MAFLSSTSRIKRDADYTFRFRLPSIFVFENLSAKLTAAGIGLGGVRASHSFFDKDVSFQFTWFGSDGEFVGDLSREMLRQLPAGTVFLDAQGERINEPGVVAGEAPGKPPQGEGLAQKLGVPGLDLTPILEDLRKAISVIVLVAAGGLTVYFGAQFVRLIRLGRRGQ